MLTLLRPCQPRRARSPPACRTPLSRYVTTIRESPPQPKLVISLALEGWVFLATVIDCATRKVIGWAMDDNYRTPLITSAIEMAARNLDLPADAVFHSDRGSNYTSGEFAAVLERLAVRQSVGRAGICFDNSLAEIVQCRAES